MEACSSPQKRAELLDSLMLTRRICAIALYFFVLAYCGDYFFNHRRIFVMDSSSWVLGAILVGMLALKLDADTKIKILLSQK